MELFIFAPVVLTMESVEVLMSVASSSSTRISDVG